MTWVLTRDGTAALNLAHARRLWLENGWDRDGQPDRYEVAADFTGVRDVEDAPITVFVAFTPDRNRSVAEQREDCVQFLNLVTTRMNEGGA